MEILWQKIDYSTSAGSFTRPEADCSGRLKADLERETADITHRDDVFTSHHFRTLCHINLVDYSYISVDTVH